MKEIFPGIFYEGRKLYTKDFSGKQREWHPDKSKLAAAILNGLKEMAIKDGNIILYLGASTGTTVSHVSDIVGPRGIIYAIEFSERVFHSLIELSEKRKNIAPLLADARKPESYSWVEEVDIVYVDIADIQEIEIFIRNTDIFLKGNGHGMIAIKSQSIDVTKDPQEIYEISIEKLKKANFKILEFVKLDPYEKHHGLVLVKR